MRVRDGGRGHHNKAMKKYMRLCERGKAKTEMSKNRFKMSDKSASNDRPSGDKKRNALTGTTICLDVFKMLLSYSVIECLSSGHFHLCWRIIYSH